MSRRSLRPQLNQIRGWVRQGRTDAWIAHQLEVTVQQIQAFKREQGLEPDEDDAAAVEEVDLRAEDDAQIAAELEEEAARRAEDRVLREIDRLAAIFSGYDPSSEFRRWQDNAPKGGEGPREVAVSPELFDLLQACDRWRERSGGSPSWSARSASSRSTSIFFGEPCGM